jgi:hypothetical protein
MIKNEAGRVVLNDITLIEYNEGHGYHGKYFIQTGVVGVYCTEKELKDLYTVLNYYCNIEDFAQCNIKIGEENVAIR